MQDSSIRAGGLAESQANEIGYLTADSDNI